MVSDACVTRRSSCRKRGDSAGSAAAGFFASESSPGEERGDAAAKVMPDRPSRVGPSSKGPSSKGPSSERPNTQRKVNFIATPHEEGSSARGAIIICARRPRSDLPGGRECYPCALY